MTPIEQAKAAIASGDIQALAFLEKALGNSAFVELKDPKFNRGLLHWSARFDNAESASWLAAKGCKVDALDLDGSTPLHVAAMNGSLECARFLCEAGAAIDIRNSSGKTPLHFAESLSARGPAFVETARILLAKGADIKSVDNQGQTGSQAAEELGRRRLPAQSPSTPQIGVDNPIANALMSQMQHLSGAVAGLGGDSASNGQPAQPKDAVAQGGTSESSENMDRQTAIKTLLGLGFEMLGAKEGAPRIEGRESECEELATMLDRGKNVIIVGKAGVGKRAMARSAAERLMAKGKIAMAVPSSSFRGNKYAGSVNENIQKWMGAALALGDELVLFINDAHQLSTGKTSSDSTDTPMQILREKLDPNKERHLTLLCATTQKEVSALEADEAFMGLFSRKDVKPMDAKEALAAMLSPAGSRQALREHPDAPRQGYEELAKLSVSLCDKYLFNLAFPAKSFEFAARALAIKPPQEWSKTELTELFCDSYKVPREIAFGKLSESSPFYSLEQALKAKLVGQDGPVEEAADTISSQIALANPKSHKPVGMLFAGPTGVGKTEMSETIAAHLGLPILSLSMGEYKSQYDANRLKDKLSEFASKNYAGVALFDEIEKSDPEVRDVLLNFFDKGIVGSGDEQVKCGFVIGIATTNVGASEMVRIKRQLRELDGNPKMHDSWIRGKMIESGFRPEMVNRIDLACDFNDITHQDALAIAKMMIKSKAADLKATKGLSIEIDDSVAKEHAADVFDSEFGARGIRRCVDSVLQRITANRQIALAIGEGTVVKAKSDHGAIQAEAIDAQGRSVSCMIRQKDDEKDRLRLNQAIGALESFANSIHSASQSAAASRRTPRP